MKELAYHMGWVRVLVLPESSSSMITSLLQIIRVECEQGATPFGKRREWLIASTPDLNYPAFQTTV